MATNKISMGINYRKKTNSRMTGSGNYFAEVDRRETLTTRGLAEHLKEHGCLAGLDAIQAVLVKISQCVPELVAQGIGVKLDGLGIFYPTVKNKKGGATEAQMLDKDFTPSPSPTGEGSGNTGGGTNTGGNTGGGDNNGGGGNGDEDGDAI